MNAVHLGDKLLDLVSEVGRGVDDTRWTACGLRTDPDYPTLAIVTDLSLVTCGNCKRSKDAPKHNAVAAE